jgi:hypothetical protein
LGHLLRDLIGVLQADIASLVVSQLAKFVTRVNIFGEGFEIHLVKKVPHF